LQSRSTAEATSSEPAFTADGNVFGYIGIRLLITVDDIAGDGAVDQAGIDGVHTDATPCLEAI
jgi:hypothetical protein